MAVLMNTYNNPTTTLIRGEGACVWDDKGQRYLDALSGIAVCGLGHNHPKVTQAITQQASSLLHCSNLYRIQAQQDLAAKLVEISGMSNVFFSNSGAEANEAAIKIARKWGNERGIAAPEIITTVGSFHGRTMATLSATGNEKVKTGFTPLLAGFKHAEYNSLESIKAQATDNTVAVMVEPIQGEGGIHVPSEDYLEKLRALCDQRAWLLILDEIQTGNGRTGKYFAFQHSAIHPDILTTAKGLGNGLPIGACLASGNAAHVLQPGNHGSTFGGNPLACATALAVVNAIEDESLCYQATRMGDYIRTQLQTALEGDSRVVDIRGKGLMLGIELHQPCGQLVDDAKIAGLLINVTAGNTIRLLPPLIITHEEADEIVEKVVALVQSTA